MLIFTSFIVALSTGSASVLVADSNSATGAALLMASFCRVFPPPDAEETCTLAPCGDCDMITQRSDQNKIAVNFNSFSQISLSVFSLATLRTRVYCSEDCAVRIHLATSKFVYTLPRSDAEVIVCEKGRSFAR